MNDMRKSSSKLEKDFEHRIGSKKHAPGRAGADTAGETASSSASLLGPGPRATASDHGKEGAGSGAGLSQAHPRDSSPQQELVPADEGRRNDPRREEEGVDEMEVSRRHSGLDLDAEGAAGSGPGQEAERVSSPLSMTSISRKQEPDST